MIHINKYMDRLFTRKVLSALAVLVSLFMTLAIEVRGEDPLESTNVSYRYAINLQSSVMPVDRSDLPKLDVYKKVPSLFNSPS